ncbi:hypothetical protein ACQ7B2_31240, partial [Escherichia coli]
MIELQLEPPHPYVVLVPAGPPFRVSEPIPGGALAAMGCDLAAGLAEAHRYGLTHGRLSPRVIT